MKTLERERRTKRRHRWFPWAYEVWPLGDVKFSLLGWMIVWVSAMMLAVGGLLLIDHLFFEPQHYTCYGGRTLVFIDGQALCFESAIPATEVSSG